MGLYIIGLYPSSHPAVTHFELDDRLSQLSNTAHWPQVPPLGPFFLPLTDFATELSIAASFRS
jgi:hypothetical protein